MRKELQSVHNTFLKIMESEQGVLGAWYFGSLANGTTDEHSDIDIVFLVEETAFSFVDKKLARMLGKACDEVILCWPENFNSNAIKNYGYLIKQNQKLFQYDVFLLNIAQIDDFMCQIHYTDLKENDIAFNKNGSIQALIQKNAKGSLWQEDISKLIITYWFHVQMTAKYFARKDFFKLEGVLRILMDTHTSLLLTAYDNITWGGSANKLHYIDVEKQKHLMKYGCLEDFVVVRNNLTQAIVWFEEDVREIGNLSEVTLNEKILYVIKKDWLTRVGAML
jgi:predicted nucleotidyltransferase